MLDRVEHEGTHSYRTFRTPRELGRLVRDDLAVLLSERFAAARPSSAGRPPEAQRTQPRPGSAPSRPSASRTRSVPASTTSLIGRGEAVDDVVGLLGQPEMRLVTLTGPGGIGKTRLAMAVGDTLSARSDMQIAFVQLAGVTEPGAVVGATARAVGLDLTMTSSPLDALVGHLGDDAWLLILTPRAASDPHRSTYSPQEPSTPAGDALCLTLCVAKAATRSETIKIGFVIELTIGVL